MDKDIHAFVIRVWNEGAGAGSANTWRGYIEHVNHDNRMYFYDLNGVARYIQQQIGFQSKKQLFGWRTWLSRVKHAIKRSPK